MSEVYRAPAPRPAADRGGDSLPWAAPSAGPRRNALLAVGLVVAGALTIVGLFALLMLGLPTDPGDHVGDLERLEDFQRDAMIVGFGGCGLAALIAAALGISRLRWHSTQVFVPPPGWPAPPERWRPAAGWRPDPSWPPPPPDWKFWQHTTRSA